MKSIVSPGARGNIGGRLAINTNKAAEKPGMTIGTRSYNRPMSTAKGKGISIGNIVKVNGGGEWMEDGTQGLGLLLLSPGVPSAS